MPGPASQAHAKILCRRHFRVCLGPARCGRTTELASFGLQFSDRVKVRNRTLAMRPGGKRIALFLDGTWNTVRDNTNVWRLRALCAEKSADGARQIVYYDQGVGTRSSEKLRGGMFGYGLDSNVIAAYRWLIENYSPGDDVFVFGFSRGAFTARSLTGLIAKCGLLQPGAPLSVEQVFRRYIDSKILRPIYQLQFEQRELRRRLKWGGSATDEPRIFPLSREEQWLLTYSQRISIEFTGVFDTVGSLGVPFGNFWFSSKRFQFHHTRLSNLYRRTFQALAIDEHRRHFPPAIWTKFTPQQIGAQARIPRFQPLVEQRWFMGAHANVGGGYIDDRLAQIPLAWFAEKASAAGLRFRYPVQIDPDSFRDPIADSYSRFAGGLYKVATLGARHLRTIGSDGFDVTAPAGHVNTVNETIDASVFDRWRNDAAYRPQNLVSWASHKQVIPADLVGSVSAESARVVI